LFVWLVTHQTVVLFSRNKPTISKPPVKRTVCCFFCSLERHLIIHGSNITETIHTRHLLPRILSSGQRDSYLYIYFSRIHHPLFPSFIQTTHTRDPLVILYPHFLPHRPPPTRTHSPPPPSLLKSHPSEAVGGRRCPPPRPSLSPPARPGAPLL
jgi:hypothetical protein